jgi:hypothetical protein
MDLKVGLKTSINISTLTGTELQNPFAKYGYSAGIYLQTNPKKKLFIQPEVIGSFRGSTFRNGLSEYNKIALFYLDASPLLVYAIDPDKKHQIAVGPTFSTLLLSSVFVQGQKKAEENNLPLQPFDFNVSGYYQLVGKAVGFQTGIKIGLLNISDDFVLPSILPASGNGGTIKSVSFEIGFLF